MCEFISWIERDGAVVFLTGRDLKTSRGKAMRERIGDDVCGHGAIREYWDIAPGVGTERECDDFSTPDNFPALIVDAIKNGEFRGIGIAEGLLTPEAWVEYKRVTAPAWAEYRRVNDAASAEYRRVNDAALAEYRRVNDAAWAEYKRVTAPAWAEYRRVNDAASAEYRRVNDAAWAEYERATAPAWAEYRRATVPAGAEYDRFRDTSFWNLFANPNNRPKVWR